MSKVFVLDTMEHPLDPVHPGWARKLLSAGKAAVFRRYPFTIILKIEVEQSQFHSLASTDEDCNGTLRLKIDPGSKTTGLAIVNDASGEVVFAAELTHRGQAIKSRLDDRRAIRRSRRNRKTRYRKPRFKNRRNKKKGWLPPSTESRLANILTWVNRLRWYCPITAISQEWVKFDTQAMENPEISGVEYQQGTLAGYEVKEYLLEKWNYQCAYCGAKDVPLHVEHIQCLAKNGSNRVSNLTMACKKCNNKKGTQDIREFLKSKPEVMKRILAQAKAPLKDVAAVNTTRWALFERLKGLGLPIELGSGGLTKYNRSTRALPKTHWLDAACVGKSTPAVLYLQGVQPLLIQAKGSGHRHICRVDGYGFPVKVGKDEREVEQNGRLSGKERHKLEPYLMTQKRVVGEKLIDRPLRRIGEDTRKTIKSRKQKRSYGFQTGDMVRANIPKGKNVGVHVGRMYIDSAEDGKFYFGSGKDRIRFSHKYCTPLHHADGYSYAVTTPPEFTHGE